MRIHPEGKSWHCSELGRVLVLSDPPARFLNLLFRSGMGPQGPQVGLLPRRCPGGAGQMLGVNVIDTQFEHSFILFSFETFRWSYVDVASNIL